MLGRRGLAPPQHAGQALPAQGGGVPGRSATASSSRGVGYLAGLGAGVGHCLGHGFDLPAKGESHDKEPAPPPQHPGTRPARRGRRRRGRAPPPTRKSQAALISRLRAWRETAAGEDAAAVTRPGRSPGHGAARTVSRAASASAVAPTSSASVRAASVVLLGVVDRDLRA